MIGNSKFGFERKTQQMNKRQEVPEAKTDRVSKNSLVTKEMADQIIQQFFNTKNSSGFFQRNKYSNKINCDEIQKLLKDSEEIKIYNLSQGIKQNLFKFINYDKNNHNITLETQLGSRVTSQIKRIQMAKVVNKIDKKYFSQVEILLKVLQNHIKYVVQLQTFSKSSNIKAQLKNEQDKIYLTNEIKSDMQINRQENTSSPKISRGYFYRSSNKETSQITADLKEKNKLVNSLTLKNNKLQRQKQALQQKLSTYQSMEKQKGIQNKLIYKNQINKEIQQLLNQIKSLQIQKSINLNEINELRFKIIQEQKKSQQLLKSNNSFLKENQTLQQEIKKTKQQSKQLLAKSIQIQRYNSTKASINRLGSFELSKSQDLGFLSSDQIIMSQNLERINADQSRMRCKTLNQRPIEQKYELLINNFNILKQQLKQQKINNQQLRDKLTYALQLNKKLQQLRANLKIKHQQCEIEAVQRLSIEISELKQKNSDLKKQLKEIKRLPRQNELNQLRKSVKDLQRQNKRWNNLFTSRNQQKEQMLRKNYQLTEELQKLKIEKPLNLEQQNQLLITLRSQYKAFKQEHKKIVQQEVLKAIKQQQKHINAFLKQNNHNIESYFENEVIPARKKQWEKSVKQLFNQEKILWQKQICKKYNIPTEEPLQNPEKIISS